VRTANPQLAVAASARFARGEGYDTPLAALSVGTPRGPIVSHEGREYAPLETDFLQLRALRTLDSTAYDIGVLVRPAGVGASASAAAGSSAAAADGSSSCAARASLPDDSRTRAALGSLHAAVVAARTQADQSVEAHHARTQALGQALLAGIVAARRATREQAAPRPGEARAPP
jgi:hypothetical protein